MTNETSATGGVMYADEGPYTIDVRHLCLASIAKFCDGGLSGNVEEMVGTTREATDCDRVRQGRDGDKTGDETGCPGVSGNKTCDKMAATAGDERDGGDRWSNVYGRREIRI